MTKWWVGALLVALSQPLLSAPVLAATSVLASPAAVRTFDAGVEATLADARRRGIDRLPFPQLVQAVAMLPSLLGKPYVAGTLDQTPDAETLQVSLDGFDCVTYAETVLALSRTLALQGSAATFERELAALRYRHGEPAYCERLHYFTDWIRSNAARGVVDEVTVPVAGDASMLAFHALPAGVDFMSRHAAKLPALADSPTRRQCVDGAEQSLSAGLPRNSAGVPGISYIDTAQLARVGDRLRGGDILALVAETPGLDVIHVGIVLDGVDGGRRRFAHASSLAGHVAVAADLRAWLAAAPRARGAIVIRPLSPSDR